jgi:hypothetical protein
MTFLYVDYRPHDAEDDGGDTGDCDGGDTAGDDTNPAPTWRHDTDADEEGGGGDEEGGGAYVLDGTADGDGEREYEGGDVRGRYEETEESDGDGRTGANVRGGAYTRACVRDGGEEGRGEDETEEDKDADGEDVTTRAGEGYSADFTNTVPDAAT